MENKHLIFYTEVSAEAAYGLLQFRLGLESGLSSRSTG